MGNLTNWKILFSYKVGIKELKIQPDLLKRVKFITDSWLKQLTLYLQLMHLFKYQLMTADESRGIILPVHDHSIQRSLSILIWTAAIAHRAVTLLDLTHGTAPLHSVHGGQILVEYCFPRCGSQIAVSGIVAE